MKKYNWLPWAVAALSLEGWGLRLGLYAEAVDVKGLLIRNHPVELALWAVMALGTAVILLLVRKLGGSGAYEDNFSPSPAAALGHIFLGGCILVTVLGQPFSGTPGLLWKILGFVSAPALVWGGVCRYLGKKPFFGIHAAPCLFLLMHVICRYPGWSGNPQLQDYVFELLSAISLVLLCYQLAVFEAAAGSRRKMLTTGLLAVLLAGPALSGTEFTALYLGGALFAAVSLCSLTPPEVDVHGDS